MRVLSLLVLLIGLTQVLSIVHRPINRSLRNQALNVPTDHSVFETSISAQNVAFSHSVTMDEIEPLMQNMYESDSLQKQPKTCAPCVKNGTIHIIEELWKAKIEECKNKTGKRADWCQWIKDHPKFYTGFLFAKYHPVYQSFLYCSGAERCKIHGGCHVSDFYASGDSRGELNDAEHAEIIGEIIKDANIRSGLSASTSSFDSINHRLKPSNHQWMNFNEIQSKEKNENEVQSKEKNENDESFVDRMIHAGRRTGRRLGMTHHSHHSRPHKNEISTCESTQCMSGRCGNCLKLTIEGELAADFVCISVYCEKHAKDPKIAKMCKAIQQNLAFTAGYLYGYTQPYKFAIGYCLGSGTCSTGDFMHHNQSMS